VSLPTLVLWADSVEEVWRPQGRVRIIREADGIRGIVCGRVIHELAQFVPLGSVSTQ